jgi:hypothetical protein
MSATDPKRTWPTTNYVGSSKKSFSVRGVLNGYARHLVSRGSLCSSVGNSALAWSCTGLAAQLSKRREVEHKKEGHEVDGDQHQGQDGHQIACRLNLKCVPRRRSQETQAKRIREIEKAKHVPRCNKTCGLMRRSRISKTHNRCQEAYDDVAQSSGQGKEAGQRPCCR